MGQRINALRGMRDILPDEVKKWQYVEGAAKVLFKQYGYDEIRVPILEETALFKRSIGEETDIVQKQMYSFRDRGQRPVTLRPEGTASIVRAYLEHDLAKRLPISKFYYIGPMFRNERPQAGRLRQFYQLGAEAIGSCSPYLDAELICLMMNLLKVYGLEAAELSVNSLGCENDKKAFEHALKKALAGELNRLCKDCGKRYEKNILRLFDCKNESCRHLLRQAPKLDNYLCQACKGNLNKIKTALDSVGIKYIVNTFLVRGLDYYTGTVFEVTHKDIGSQDAVAAGGRYDDLIKEMGGGQVAACGFAIGVDRVLLAAGDKISSTEEGPELFLIGLGDEARGAAFKILTELRNKGIPCQMGLDEKSLKSQMRLADRLRARRVLIIGETELKSGAAILRNMENKEQKEMRLEDVADTHLW